VFVATADGDPLELDDIAERVEYRYLYRVRAVDLAAQEGPPSGVSEPGQGIDVTAPVPPVAMAPLVTPASAVVRWTPVPDPRVTKYRVTATPRWPGAPVPTVTEGAPAAFPSPIRVENDRISLPGFVAGPPATVTSVTLGGDLAERITDGYVAAGEGRFVFWYAGGNPALVEATGNAVPTVRDRVPPEYGYGLTDGSSVDPMPLKLAGGVLDGTGLGVGPGQFTRLTMAIDGGTPLDVGGFGGWVDGTFLTCDAFEEGEQDVLELTEPTGVGKDDVRRTFGRCPAAPGQAPISVRAGVLSLGADATARLAAGDRVSGVFRAADVTRAKADRSPDPRAAAATDQAPHCARYPNGFARRLRDNVPVVVRFTATTGSGQRFLTTGTGGHPLRFRDGSLALPPWNSDRETLTGIFERAQLSLSGGAPQVPAGAINLLSHAVANASTGLVSGILTDGVPVVVTAGTRTIPARYRRLRWQERALAAGGLLGDGELQLTSLFGMAPDDQGGWTPDLAHDRLAEVRVEAGGAITVFDAPANGTPARVTYASAPAPVTADPARLEWSLSLTTADVGRSWAISVQAICELPAPVGEIASRPAVVALDITPPAQLPLVVLTAAWTPDLELSVEFAGPPNLLYRIEAHTASDRRRLLIADRPAGTTVITATAVDGTPLPLYEPLDVRLTARFPNAQKVYVSPARTVPPAATLPEPS
jgi:hypothetical protein